MIQKVNNIHAIELSEGGRKARGPEDLGGAQSLNKGGLLEGLTAFCGDATLRHYALWSLIVGHNFESSSQGGRNFY